jgi:hypothetical protein
MAYSIAAMRLADQFIKDMKRLDMSRKETLALIEDADIHSNSGDVDNYSSTRRRIALLIEAQCQDTDVCGNDCNHNDPTRACFPHYGD